MTTTTTKTATTTMTTTTATTATTTTTTTATTTTTTTAIFTGLSSISPSRIMKRIYFNAFVISAAAEEVSTPKTK